MADRERPAAAASHEDADTAECLLRTADDVAIVLLPPCEYDGVAAERHLAEDRRQSDTATTTSFNAAELVPPVTSQPTRLLVTTADDLLFAHTSV